MKTIYTGGIGVFEDVFDEVQQLGDELGILEPGDCLHKESYEEVIDALSDEAIRDFMKKVFKHFEY